MKKFKLVFSFGLLLMASMAFGQTEKTVSAIAAGTTLTDGDVGFLNMVSNADLSSNRGGGEHSATIGGSTYKAGSILTAANAKSINNAIKAWQKTYKAPDASRAGLCYYWYYYCNGYGYCYWYKYWYYC